MKRKGKITKIVGGLMAAGVIVAAFLGIAVVIKYLVSLLI